MIHRSCVRGEVTPTCWAADDGTLSGACGPDCQGYRASTAIGPIVRPEGNAPGITASSKGITSLADVEPSPIRPHITSIDLGGNLITSITDGWLAEASLLESLWLNVNKIRVLPTGFLDGASSSLKLVHLQQNSISYVPDGLFDNISSLIDLDLSGNRITVLRVGLFDNNPSLVALALQDNALSSIPVQLLPSGTPAIAAAVNAPGGFLASEQVGLRGCTMRDNGTVSCSVACTRGLGGMADDGASIRCAPFQLASAASPHTSGSCLSRIASSFVARPVQGGGPIILFYAETEVVPGLEWHEELGYDGPNCTARELFENAYANGSGITFGLNIEGPDADNQASLFINPRTARMSIAPLDLGREPSMPPLAYNGTITASDGSGAALVEVASWAMNFAFRPDLELRAGCGTDLQNRLVANVGRGNGPLERRYDILNVTDTGDRVAVTFPAFLGLGCDTRQTFDHYRSDSDGAPLISYDVCIKTAAGTVTDLGENTFINGQTGKMSFTLAPELGVGNYTVELHATSASGDPLLLHRWVMDLREPDTADAANGPNGEGCGEHGFSVDEEQQDDAFTCRCTASFTGDNCETPPAAQSTAASDDAAVIVWTLGGVIFLMLAAMIAYRVQLHRLKHRPVDVTAMQLKVMQDLGLAASTNFGQDEFGITLMFDRRPLGADAELPDQFERELVTVLAKAAPQLKAALRSVTLASAGATSTRVLAVMPKSGGLNDGLVATVVETLARKGAKGWLVAAGFSLVDASVAVPQRVPREIARSALTRIRVLGAGAFGQVHQDQLEERGSMAVFVAVKSIKAGAAGAEEARADLMREAALGALLVHRNVVSLVGICTAPRDVPALLVLAFYAEGTLKDHVTSATPDVMSVSERLTYCAQVIQGLQYISTRRIVHRDVAARNVLLDATMTCKISDLGMATALQEDGKEYVRSTEQLAIRWCSIEVIREGKYSVQSDVWAFGVLAYEVFACGTVPYSDQFDNLTEISNYIKEGGKLARPDHAACPLEVHHDLILPCFVAEPTARPAFGELYAVAVKHGAEEDDVAMAERAARRRQARSGPKGSLHEMADPADRTLLGPSIHHLEATLVPKVVAAVLHIKDHPRQKRFDSLDDPSDATIWHMVHAYAKPISKDTICPREGTMGCAYVDTLVHEDDVGQASALLSYSWGYVTREVAEALTMWAARTERDPKQTRVWMCSLCLNQHSMSKEAANPEALAAEFGDRVVAIGRILPMLEVRGGAGRPNCPPHPPTHACQTHVLILCAGVYLL